MKPRYKFQNIYWCKHIWTIRFWGNLDNIWVYKNISISLPSPLILPPAPASCSSCPASPLSYCYLCPLTSLDLGSSSLTSSITITVRLLGISAIWGILEQYGRATKANILNGAPTSDGCLKFPPLLHFLPLQTIFCAKLFILKFWLCIFFTYRKSVQSHF